MTNKEINIELILVSIVIAISTIGLYLELIDSIDFRWIIIVTLAFFEGTSLAEIIKGGM